MSTEQLITKVVDGSTPSIQATIEQVGMQGAQIVKQTGLTIPEGYDYIGVTYTDTTDIFTYKTGGSSGTVTRIITVTYSDATKSEISSVDYTI